jgi:hypothetical protein
MASVLAKKLVKHDVKVLVEELSDEDLLERFLSGEGFESQDAFRTLVVRHKPMVLGVCRHVLNHVTYQRHLRDFPANLILQVGESISQASHSLDLLHDGADLRGRERFGEIIECSTSHRVDGVVDGGVRRHDHDHEARRGESRGIVSSSLNPDSWPSRRSTNARSNGDRSIRFTASETSTASSTVFPNDSRARRRVFLMFRSSSTIRMRMN